jgi:hypothetical protein
MAVFFVVILTGVCLCHNSNFDFCRLAGIYLQTHVGDTKDVRCTRADPSCLECVGHIILRSKDHVSRRQLASSSPFLSHI